MSEDDKSSEGKYCSLCVLPDPVLDREDCLAANSRSTGPQQQNTDDQNCSDDSAERSTSADWQTADVDDQQRRPLVCSCSSGTSEPLYLILRYHNSDCEETRTRCYRCQLVYRPISNLSVLSSVQAPGAPGCPSADGVHLVRRSYAIWVPTRSLNRNSCSVVFHGGQY